VPETPWAAPFIAWKWANRWEPAMTTFVCLDTNIYVRFISQGMPGCEQEHWGALMSHVRDATVTLIVPEIVSLELERQWLLIPEMMKTKFLSGRKALEKSARAELDHSEMKEFPDALLAAYDTLAAEKIAAMETRHSEVQDLIRSQIVQPVTLSMDIRHRAYKRSLSSGTADPAKRADADCALVESLLTFFSEHLSNLPQLLLCSENKADFGPALDDKTIILHPRIATGLPANKLFLDLRSLTSFVNEQKDVEPPNAEDVKQAVDNDQERRVQNRVRDLEAYQGYLDAPASVKAMIKDAEHYKAIFEPPAGIKAMMGFAERYKTMFEPPAGI
jgi:hypothetical protein